MTDATWVLHAIRQTHTTVALIASAASGRIPALPAGAITLGPEDHVIIASEIGVLPVTA